MKPKYAALTGGICGLLIGVLFMSDIDGAPIFACFVLGFLSYECAWAIQMIGNTNSVPTRNKKDDEKARQELEAMKKAADEAALNKNKSSDLDGGN